MKFELIQNVHMTMLDIVEEMKGGMVFNEVPSDQIEFRFYLD